jgi:ABC-type nitrate/sulfonate/bicarbonate transport system permease component
MRGATPYLLAAIGLALFLGIWEAVPRLGLLPPTLLPAPSQLPAAFLREAKSGIWGDSVLFSLWHYAIGLACGTGFGIVLGVATGMYRPFDWALAWIVRVLRPIPAALPGCRSRSCGLASTRRRPFLSSRSAVSGSSSLPRRARSEGSTVT